MPRTITTEVFAILPMWSGDSPPDLRADDAAQHLMFTTEDVSRRGRDLIVGKGVITVELFESESFKSNNIAALNSRVAALQDEARAQVDALNVQIRYLQALPFKAT